MNVFRFSNLVAGLALIGTICFELNSAQAAIVTWNVDAAGNLTADSNWDATHPNAVDDTANLTFDITLARIVTLDGPITIGTLNIGDSAATFRAYTVSGANTLTFDVSSGNAQLVKNSSPTGGVSDTINTPIQLNDNLDVTIPNGFGNITLNGIISGDFGIQRLGGGSFSTGQRLILNNALNDYSGDTIITQGTLRSGALTGAIPDGPGKGNVFVDANGGFELIGATGHSETINGLSGSGHVDNGSNGVLNGASNSATLIVGNNDATSEFSGVIKNTGSNLSMIHFAKIGAGIQTLSGANVYGGTTTVSAGTLLVNGTHVPANSGGPTAGAYTVASGATLGGTGDIGAGVTVDAGGFLSPGESIESLEVDSASIAGTLQIEIDESDALVNDLLNVVGALDISAATLDVAVTGGLTQSAYVFASYGAGELTGTFASSNTPVGYHVDYNYQGNNQIALVVPEPASAVLLAFGIASIGWIRRQEKC